jgi:hypothetical protein
VKGGRRKGLAKNREYGVTAADSTEGGDVFM